MIKDINPQTVTFSYKDYRNGTQKSVMTLDAMEFIRRFSMHILPKGFVRIRHFGILSSTGKKKAFPLIRAQFPREDLLTAEPRMLEMYNPKLCPHCKTQTMINLEILPKRGLLSHAKLMETVRIGK